MVNLFKSLFLATILLLPAIATAQKQIVVMLSEATELQLKNNSVYSTGNYLNEFAIPIMALMDAGFEPLFYTPTGKKPNLDADSVDVKYFNNDPKVFDRAHKLFLSIEAEKKMRPATELSKLDLTNVAAVFVPGGHAPMIDLMINKEFGQFLKKIHSKSIVTALICHGPIALISAIENPVAFVHSMKAGKITAARKDAAGWIYAGYNMTIFSTEEEIVAEKGKLKGEMYFYPQNALSSAGGFYKSKKAWSSNVVIDRELITGQNPNSVNEFTDAVLAAVKKKSL